MGAENEPVLIRRDAEAPGGPARTGLLVLNIVVAAAAGTIGFYFSVVVAFLLANADIGAPETLQLMFPPGEYKVVAIVLVTSVIAYLVMDKAHLYRAIADAGAAGWIALFPVVLVTLIVLRGIAIDLVYFPLHYQSEWTILSYQFLADDPLQGAAYVIDGLFLFAISALLAKAGARR